MCVIKLQFWCASNNCLFKWTCVAANLKSLFKNTLENGQKIVSFKIERCLQQRPSPIS